MGASPCIPDYSHTSTSLLHFKSNDKRVTSMNPTLRVFLAGVIFSVLMGACAQAITPTPTLEPTPFDRMGTLTPSTPPVASELTESTCDDPFEGETVRFTTSFWPDTDFCQHSVPYAEILAGGALPPDGIPAIDQPRFESLDEGDGWLGDDWPVIVYENNGDARAYPLAILTWHEIINDDVGGEPIAITFCPLCNASIAFSRLLPDGTTLSFGTSGNLRNSDLIMYDRETQSWWQQFTGEAIVGTLTGTRLTIRPSQIVSWAAFKQAFPEGRVLSRDTGHSRAYGQNPYPGYDSIHNSPFFPVAGEDERLALMERVVGILVEDRGFAYPFDSLSTQRVVNDTPGGTPVVVLWSPGTLSALDSSSMQNSRMVGSAAAYEATLDGQLLTFEPDGEALFRDQETGSRWTIFGRAVDGELEGSRLTPIPSGVYLWFAWAAFQPDTVIWQP